MERPEPVPRPPGSSAMAKAGRENFSLSRDATRPTTPGCQPSDAVTITEPLSSSPSEASASASACASAICSMTRRSVLSRSSSAAIRAASETSASSNSRTPRSARPIRPPALMRGPSMKPRCQASGGPLSRDTSISAVCPTWSRRRIAIRPLATNARFSPVKGATSATVPSAT